MSGQKNRGARTVGDTVAESPEVPEVAAAVEAPAVAEQLAGEVVSEVAALAPKVFEVEIPMCLLGKLAFVADNEADAYEQYKKHGGINSHERPQIVKELPVGCRGYAAAVEAHEAALATKQA
jgi:hypothetical protein